MSIYAQAEKKGQHKARHDDYKFHFSKIIFNEAKYMVKFILAYKDVASEQAAKLISEILIQRDDEPFLMGTSTGRTPEKTYMEILKTLEKIHPDKNLGVFQQDTYVGKNLSGKIGLDYGEEIKASFLDKCLPKAEFFIPDGAADDLEEAAKAHTKKFLEWRKKARRYIHILGIGHNGHIGFNEPGTSFDSVTHVVDLTNDTIEQNALKYFDGNEEEVPKQALTTGLSELSQMDAAILIAFGESKADALYKTFFEMPNESIPASVLVEKNIPTYVFCDKYSAKRIIEEKGMDIFDDSFDAEEIATEILGKA